MSRTKGIAALAGIVGMLAAVVVALPAQAAAATGTASIDFEGGSIAPWVANGATVTVVAEPGNDSNHVASVTGRGTDTWKGIASATGAYTAGVQYTISARIKVPVGTSARFIANDPAATNKWVWVGDTAVAADTWTTLSGTFTFGENAPNAKVYVEVDDTTDYLLDDLVVTAPVDPCPADADVIAATGFETDAAGWQGRGATAAVGDSTAHSGTQSLAVTGRTENWQGTQLPVGSLFTGGTYTISAWVKLAPGTDPTDMKLTVQGKEGSDDTYAEASTPVSVGADTWVNLCGHYSTTDGNTPSVVYVEAASATASYFLDDVTISTAASTPEPCTPSVVSDSALDFESGADLGGWQKSGGPTLSQAVDPADSGNHVLQVANRQFSYDGIESANVALAVGTTYTVSMKVRLADGEGPRSMRIVKKPDYNWVSSNTSVTSSTWTTLTATVTPDATGWTVYLGSDPAEIGPGNNESAATFTYFVDDVSISHQGVCDEGPVPGTVLISADFEDGLQGWVAREASAGPHTVGVTTTDKHGGAQAALVSGRTSQGSGLGIDVDGVLEPGVQYELTAWAKFAGTPTANLVFTGQTGAETFTTLKTFTDVNATGWTQINTKFTLATGDRAFIYFETPWSSSDPIGNTTPFMLDDIEIKVPDKVQIQDLAPIKDSVSFPVGVAIDSRETAGPGSKLLLKHFNQVTPENFMKPEAWYNANGEWSPNSEIASLMDFAKANDLRVYGHVLVWHSQTPAWFFNKSATDSTPLTNSAADKQLLRERLEKHINDVADYLAQWGDYGDGNPITAFDVVNEVVNDGASPETGGLRNSRWYQVLGDEYIADAFRYADAAFNHGEHTAAGADRPVKLFINDYNTEQSGKRARYLTLINNLIANHVPIDGMGHQFHVSLATPVSAMDEALTAGEATGLLQAVTELDAPTGIPESEAKFIDQGYYYRDAFDVFRAHAADMFSVTLWGLTDGRSWRDSSGGPLVFDDGFQAKPAYYGIADAGSLPARIRTANSFAGDIPATAAGAASGDWNLLPLLPAGANASFQTRWASDHLTVFVDVNDATINGTDAVTVQLGATDYTLLRSGGALGAVVPRAGGYTAVLHVPLASAKAGDSIHLDVRVTDGGDTDGWNTPGTTGTVTLVEPLSHVNVPEAAVAPVVDGTLDPVWSTSSSVQTLKEISGDNGAIGTFHLLWKDQTLYVYAEVADPTVDTTGSDPWVQDSVEIYVDGGNAKNGSYRYDDTQIRISADGAVSFGTGDEPFQANRLQSSAKRVAGGYVVEAAISLLEYGGLGTVQGLDVQVNDATSGARTAIRNWADPTGTGYQTTERWGVASLVERALLEQTFVPKVSGTAVVGKTLSVTGLPKGATLTYQWLRNGSAINGAKKATYKLTTADAGKKISVRVTSVIAGYADATKTSAQTSVVLKAFAKTTAPKIAGTVKVGSKLTAKVSAWSPKASFKYQWYSNGKAIKGATKSTFTPTRSQAGTTVTVMVTGSKAGYQAVSKMSAGKKIPLLALKVGPTWLNGPTKVGGTLKVTPGASRPVTTVKTYQWYANGKAISGAKSSTYKVKAADKGKRITVKVTYRAQGFATKVVVAGPTFRIAAR